MDATIKVQVLGVGCPKCTTLEERIRRLITAHQLNVELEKVSDLREMMKYGIMTTPGLVIDGELKSAGTMPNDAEILEWLKGLSR